MLTVNDIFKVDYTDRDKVIELCQLMNNYHSDPGADNLVVYNDEYDCYNIVKRCRLDGRPTIYDPMRQGDTATNVPDFEIRRER